MRVMVKLVEQAGHRYPGLSVRWPMAECSAIKSRTARWHAGKASCLWSKSEASVSDLVAVIDAAGLDRFTLFGRSQGASVAVQYTQRHPARVDRLILHGGMSAAGGSATARVAKPCRGRW